MRRFVISSTVAAAVVVTTAAAQAPDRSFLWTVSAPGTPPTYLMGSLHLLTADYYPLSPRIEAAFAASRVLIEEADLDEVTNPATLVSLMPKAMLSDGRMLNQVIPGDLYAKVTDRAGALGLPVAAVQRMKPWLVALALTTPALQAAGFKAEHGVDKHFFDRAKIAGMERRALETVAFQFERLDQMSEADQTALLRSTLDELDTQIANVKTIAAAWARGDAASLEKELLASMKSAPALYQRLVVERNASWVAPVEQCLSQRTPCFVVVGAAHLVGPDSLVAMLQKKGYTVEQQ